MHITRIFSFLVSATFLLLLCLITVQAQTNDDCLMCHDDDTFTMDKDGKEVSIFVGEGKYNSSSHSKLKCISCHINFDPGRNSTQRKLDAKSLWRLSSEADCKTLIPSKNT